MTRKRFIDERQIGLDFDREVDEAIEVMSQLAKGHVEIAHEPEEDEPIDCDSFYILMAEACKDAIRGTGLSREQIVDAINTRLTFSDSEGTANPITIHLLNNYLSKPTLNRMPLHILKAICGITANHGPIDVFVRRLGLSVITDIESMHTELGKLDELTRHLAVTKGSIRRKIGIMRSKIT